MKTLTNAQFAELETDVRGALVVVAPLLLKWVPVINDEVDFTEEQEARLRAAIEEAGITKELMARLA